MITEAMIAAAIRALYVGAEHVTDEELLAEVGNGKERMRAALEAAERAAWRPISEALALERVIVSGIQPRHGTVAAYRWHEEDFIDEKGAPINHPNADLFRPLPIPPEAT